MGDLIDLIGHRFTRLIVVDRAPNKGTRAAWVCRCDCGTALTVDGKSLRTGNTRSCGCLKRDQVIAKNHLSTVHGLSAHPLYGTWHQMLRRCYDEAHHAFARYGGRGIIVCDRWLDLSAFIEDVGERPLGLTLDRPDNARGYGPTNWRWASYTEQRNNQRARKFKALEEHEPLQIAWLHATGYSKRSIARFFGVDHHTISLAIQRAGPMLAWANPAPL